MADRIPSVLNYPDKVIAGTQPTGRPAQTRGHDSMLFKQIRAIEFMLNRETGKTL
jgi:hypothetical protein